MDYVIFESSLTFVSSSTRYTVLSPADADVMVINAIFLSLDTSSSNGFMLHNLLQLCLRDNMHSFPGSILIHLFSSFHQSTSLAMPFRYYLFYWPKAVLPDKKIYSQSRHWVIRWGTLSWGDDEDISVFVAVITVPAARWWQGRDPLRHIHHDGYNIGYFQDNLNLGD